MKWKKLGQIFNPRHFKLPNECVEYAQAPQALVCDDFVRIYFSTRFKEPKSGKFLSHIAFVEFDKAFSKSRNVSEKNIIELGALGTFDEHGIFPMNVLRVEDKIYAYTCGWSRRVSVSVETGIGLATSSDGGLTFQKSGDGPILTSSLHEPFLVGDGFVQKFGGHISYVVYFWRSLESFFQKNRRQIEFIKLVTQSLKMELRWTKTGEGQQIVPDRLNDDESQALPTVIHHNGEYHMFFCYRESFDFRKVSARGYRIGYARSTDLVNWKRSDEEVGIDTSPEGWDSEMLCYPHVFHCDNKVYLLYNGNEFGRHGFGLAVLE